MSNARPLISASTELIVQLMYAAFTDDQLIAYIKESLLSTMTELQISDLIHTALEVHDYNTRKHWEHLLRVNLQLDCSGLKDQQVFEKALPYILHELNSGLEDPDFDEAS